jgi:bacterioferritin-associated ferredoxin
VRDRAIVKAIRHGAATLDDVRALCGAATQCGGCEPAIEALLECHAQPASTQSSSAPA